MGSSTNTSKRRRQRRIAMILRSRPVRSQAELMQILEREGFRAAQATISRDLEELGVVKVRDKDGVTLYRLGDEGGTPSTAEGHLERVMGEWVQEIESSLNLVVVKTPPGCAHVVASAIDRAGLDGVAGTVAGDDTVLVVARESVEGKVLATRLREIAGL
ncbi:MAG: arginine repressor [Acidimicrobiales bacterium]|nr:MAG: arginine repressor [Acidimicrobiales bacterium]